LFDDAALLRAGTALLIAMATAARQRMLTCQMDRHLCSHSELSSATPS
jgi:hypothetical protein